MTLGIQFSQRHCAILSIDSSEANYYAQDQVTSQEPGQSYSNDAFSYSRTNPQQTDKNGYGLQDELNEAQYFARDQQQGQYSLSENNTPAHSSAGSDGVSSEQQPGYAEPDNYGAYNIAAAPQQSEFVQPKEKLGFPTNGNTGQQISGPLQYTDYRQQGSEFGNKQGPQQTEFMQPKEILAFPTTLGTGQPNTDYQQRGIDFGIKQGLPGALRETIQPQQTNTLSLQTNTYTNNQQQYVYGERRGNLAIQQPQQQTMFMQPRKNSVFLRRENSIPTHASNILGYVNSPQKSTTESSTWRTTPASNAGTKKDTSDAETQRQINDLQLQIANTTKQIDDLYRSVLNGEKQDEHNMKAMMKNGLNGNIEERLKNTSCDSADIRQFREDIKIEKEVRNRMIKLLAKAKMENERKTKALQAVLKYYHPDQTVLNKLGIPASLKRVILTEKIKLLSKQKRVELARRWNLLKKKHGMRIKKKVRERRTKGLKY